MLAACSEVVVSAMSRQSACTTETTHKRDRREAGHSVCITVAQADLIEAIRSIVMEGHILPDFAPHDWFINA